VKTAQRAPGTSQVTGGGKRAVVFALARAEGRRLLRHPLVVTGAVMSGAMFVLTTWDSAPVLGRDDILIGAALLPFAATVFLAENMAALRSRRDGTEELYEGLVAPPAARTEGHLLSVLWPLGLGVGLVLAMTGFLLANHPVGLLSLLELAVGPVLVALLGALGILLSRWWPWTAAGPIVLVALASVQVALIAQITPSDSLTRYRWLAPWNPLSTYGEPSPELVVRPSGWHLLYLVGLVAVFGAGAAARHRPRRGALVTVSAGLLLLLTGGIVQLQSPSSAAIQRMVALVEHPLANEACRTSLGVTYCAYRNYAPWISRWQNAISPVLQRVPPEARPAGVILVQALDPFGSDVERRLPPNIAAHLYGAPAFDPDPTIRPGTTWGRGADEGRDQLVLGLIVASRAVGLPATPAQIVLTDADYHRLNRNGTPGGTARPGGHWDQCETTGQSRAVVALWLAAQANVGTAGALRAAVASTPYGIQVQREGDRVVGWGTSGPFANGLNAYPFYQVMRNFPIIWGEAEAIYAARLLDQPADRVAAVFRRNWGVLTDPETKTAVLLQEFGLRALPTFAEQLRQVGEPPARAAALAQQYLFGTVPCR
jgi:hypothetical protein